MEVFWKKLQKTYFFAISAILGVPRARPRFFGAATYASNHKAHKPLLLCKKSKKSNEAFLSKLRKTLFLGIFGCVWAWQCGAATFFKNPALSLFCNHGPLPSCKKSEKTIERFPRKRRYERTNERTNGRTVMNS